MKIEPTKEYWCIDSNVKSEIPFGPNGDEIKSGLRKFKAGAKLHIIGSYPGMCESLVVIGRHRNANNYIRCVIQASSVENLRVKKVYSEKILQLLQRCPSNGASMITTENDANHLKQLIPKWVEEIK